MKILIITISFLFANSDESQFVGMVPVPPKEKAPITLLASAPVYCSDQSQLKDKDCEKVLVHEISLDQLQYLVVDGRSQKKGNFDVNKLIKNPENYTGEIKTVILKDEFSGLKEDIKTVSAHFIKDNRIKITVRTPSSVREKVIPEP